MADRTPAKARESHRRSLITKWHKAMKAQQGRLVSLKAFVRSLSDDEGRLQAEDWFFNKSANTAKPPQGIGRTRTRVKSGGGPKAPAKNLSGR